MLDRSDILDLLNYGGKPVWIILDPSEDMAGMNVRVPANALEEGKASGNPFFKWAHRDKALLCLD